MKVINLSLIFISRIWQISSLLRDNCDTYLDCDSESEFCGLSKRCECLQNVAFEFNGKCLFPKRFGDECISVIQCVHGAKDNDPYTACIDQKCQCREGTKYFQGKCRNETQIEKVKTSGSRNDEATPKDTPDINNMKINNIDNDETYSQHENHQQNGLIGSIGVIILSMILFACCFCFWTMGKSSNENSNSNPDHEIGFDGQPIEHSSNGDQRNTHHKYENYDDIELKLGTDNPCFHDDHSHYSATTDICEMSHKDIIAKQITMEELEGDFSLSPSMDENDCEVAIFNAMGTLKRAQESAAIAATVNLQQPIPIRKIELVPDGECTSIESYSNPPYDDKKSTDDNSNDELTSSRSSSKSSIRLNEIAELDNFNDINEKTPPYIDDTDEEHESLRIGDRCRSKDTLKVPNNNCDIRCSSFEKVAIAAEEEANYTSDDSESSNSNLSNSSSTSFEKKNHYETNKQPPDETHM